MLHGARDIFLIDSNDKVINDQASIRRMIMSLGFICNVVLKTVTTKEKFSHISTDQLPDNEATAWVMINEFFDIED